MAGAPRDLGTAAQSCSLTFAGLARLVPSNTWFSCLFSLLVQTWPSLLHPKQHMGKQGLGRLYCVLLGTGEAQPDWHQQEEVVAEPCATSLHATQHRVSHGFASLMPTRPGLAHLILSGVGKQHMAQLAQPPHLFTGASPAKPVLSQAAHRKAGPAATSLCVAQDVMGPAKSAPARRSSS